jgi:glycosyltransferase involved in cell wall biosynthesis
MSSRIDANNSQIWSPVIASFDIDESDQVARRSQPHASIVITCYNQSEFLADAITSALLQSASNLELIVVDDGSTDKTETVATRFRNVKYLRQDNAGLSKARNAGLNASGGQFIAFLDADDRLLPHALATGIRKLDGCPDYAFAAGGFRHIDEKGETLSLKKAPIMQGARYSNLLRLNVVQMHGAVLYRREILKAIGGFDEMLLASEDYDVYLRLARRYQFVQYEDIIAEYRQHGRNMTRDAARMLVSTISVLQAQRPFIAHKPDLTCALDAGLNHYRSTYGRALLRNVIRRTKYPNEWRTAIHELALVLRLAPIAFFSSVGVILGAVRRHWSDK